jgi:hypothetical protein
VRIQIRWGRCNPIDGKLIHERVVDYNGEGGRSGATDFVRNLVFNNTGTFCDGQIIVDGNVVDEFNRYSKEGG